MPKQSWSQHNKSLHVCSLIFSKHLKLLGILHRIMTQIFRHLNCANPRPPPVSLHPLPAVWATCALAKTLTISSIYLFTPPASHRLKVDLELSTIQSIHHQIVISPLLCRNSQRTTHRHTKTAVFCFLNSFGCWLQLMNDSARKTQMSPLSPSYSQSLLKIQCKL